MRYPNVTGVTGVSRIKTKWGIAFRANATIDGETINLKQCVDFFEAVCARKSAEVNLPITR